MAPVLPALQFIYIPPAGVVVAKSVVVYCWHDTATMLEKKATHLKFNPNIRYSMYSTKSPVPIPATRWFGWHPFVV